MLYYHRDDAQVFFECCFQCVVLTTFLGKIVNEILNQDKVSLPRTVFVVSMYFLINSKRFRFTDVTNRFRLRISLRRYDRQIRNLYEAMDNHWNVFTCESEIRVLKDYTSRSRKFTIFHSCEYISSICVCQSYKRREFCHLQGK